MLCTICYNIIPHNNLVQSENYIFVPHDHGIFNEYQLPPENLPGARLSGVFDFKPSPRASFDDFISANMVDKFNKKRNK